MGEVRKTSSVAGNGIDGAGNDLLLFSLLLTCTLSRTLDCNCIMILALYSGRYLLTFTKSSMFATLAELQSCFTVI